MSGTCKPDIDPATGQPPPGKLCSSKKRCTAGEKCANGKCKPDPERQCPAGKYHDGKQCVDGDPPDNCSAGKEFIAGKCVKECAIGLKRVGTKCKDDVDHMCDEGETKSPTKGCVAPGSGGLAQTLAEEARIAAAAAAAAALTAGLSAGTTLATQAVLSKFNTSYNSFTKVINARNEALQKQIEEITMPIPDDETRDKMMDIALSKPVEGSTAKIRIWGRTPASDTVT
jgi:hypothetical protein